MRSRFVSPNPHLSKSDRVETACWQNGGFIMKARDWCCEMSLGTSTFCRFWFRNRKPHNALRLVFLPDTPVRKLWDARDGKSRLMSFLPHPALAMVPRETRVDPLLYVQSPLPRHLSLWFARDMRTVCSPPTVHQFSLFTGYSMVKTRRTAWSAIDCSDWLRAARWVLAVSCMLQTGHRRWDCPSGL